MTLQFQEVGVDPVATDAEEYQLQSVVDMDSETFVEEEQHYRASAYGLIATLLKQPPDQSMLDHIGSLQDSTQAEGDQLMLSMSALGLSAGMHSPSSIEDEFQELFIGLGKGEVVPYASWYLTGFLMEKPLSDLRSDLTRLGYQRSEETSEPEDHAAALCEVISLMIQEGTNLQQQRDFFQSHMVAWMGRFFNDLAEAKSAVFYKAVGRFGSAFLALENEYLSMQT